MQTQCQRWQTQQRRWSQSGPSELYLIGPRWPGLYFLILIIHWVWTALGRTVALDIEQGSSLWLRQSQKMLKAEGLLWPALPGAGQLVLERIMVSTAAGYTFFIHLKKKIFVFIVCFVICIQFNFIFPKYQPDHNSKNSSSDSRSHPHLVPLLVVRQSLVSGLFSCTTITPAPYPFKSQLLLITIEAHLCWGSCVRNWASACF